ncbi:MAG TPA: hypothetical protein VEQ41_02700, partial [Solirubrobacterales bacterium]|nr:hypothetical protein [Solirubrobacterales bacterium]
MADRGQRHHGAHSTLFVLLVVGSIAALVLAVVGRAAEVSKVPIAQTSTIGGQTVGIADAQAVVPAETTADEGAAKASSPETSSETPVAEAPSDPTEAELDEAREKLEREEALSTPEAVAEREASRYAYTDLLPEQAEALLRERFAAQLAQIDADPSRVLSDVVLEEITSPTEALVSIEGEKALLESSVPLRAPDDGIGMTKVDLGLEETEGRFAPRNSLVDVSLPKSAADRIQVGGIGLNVATERAATSVARPFGEEDLYLPEVAEDTGLLLSPITGGVEVSALVLSRRSPEQLSFEVAMPAGARLLPSPEGGAEVVDVAQGKVLATISAPHALDAQGTDIPVALSVKGNSVVLELAHRSMDIAYPAFIDPEIEENWWGFADTSKLNYWSWQWSGVGPEDYIGWRSCIVKCWGSGLYVRSRSNFTYPAGSYGRWWFVPQGSTTYLRRVIFG